jgi:hypothetical protein
MLHCVAKCKESVDGVGEQVAVHGDFFEACCAQAAVGRGLCARRPGAAGGVPCYTARSRALRVRTAWNTEVQRAADRQEEMRMPDAADWQIKIRPVRVSLRGALCGRG